MSINDRRIQSYSQHNQIALSGNQNTINCENKNTNITNNYNVISQNNYSQLLLNNKNYKIETPATTNDGLKILAVNKLNDHFPYNKYYPESNNQLLKIMKSPSKVNEKNTGNYDWQRYLFENKEYPVETTQDSLPTNFTPQSQEFNNISNELNVLKNNNHNKLSEQPVYFKTNFKDNSDALSRSNSAINIIKNTKITDNTNKDLKYCKTQINENSSTILNENSNSLLNILIEEKDKNIKNMQEKLDVFFNENFKNKIIIKKLTEENSELLLETKQIKQEHFLLQKKSSNEIMILDIKLKEYEKEIPFLKNQLDLKNKLLEISDKSLKELNEEKNLYIKGLKLSITEQIIFESEIYSELKSKYENLEEENKKLNRYNSDLQTLNKNLNEEIQNLKPKGDKTNFLEKSLESLQKSYSLVSSQNYISSEKLIDSEKKLQQEISKNILIKKENETLEKNINQLNKEIENLKSEQNKDPNLSNSEFANFFNSRISNSFNSSKNYKLNKPSNFKLEFPLIHIFNKSNNLNAFNLQDLPNIINLELEEKEKTIQILQCAIEEKDKIIEQIKIQQNKSMITNKEYKDEINKIKENLNLKIINLEKENAEKNNLIITYNTDFNNKKLEAERLIFENKQLKEQLNIIPSLNNEIKNLTIELKKQISQTNELKDLQVSKDLELLRLEKSTNDLKNDIEMKANQLQSVIEEFNTKNVNKKKKDLITSTLEEIKELKYRICGDKNNFISAFLDYYKGLNSNYNINADCEVINKSLIFKNENENIEISGMNHDIISDSRINLTNSIRKGLEILDSISTNGSDLKLNLCEEDLKFYKTIIKNFDLNLLSKFDFILNSKNWGIIRKWFYFFSKKSNFSRRRYCSYSSGENPGFKLVFLFKASKDGYSHLDFKNKCLGKINTLVIAKTNYDKIIGGFTPLSWENTDEHIYLKDDSDRSFIFSVDMKKKLKIINHEYAICLSPNSGPIFGGGSDLEIVDNCNTNFNKFYRVGYSYEYTDTPESFFGAKKYLIKDYEVYQVTDYY